MGKPKLNKTPNKKGSTRTTGNAYANKEEDKKQTKISSYFAKSISKTSNSLLVPDLKKFSSKTKSFSSSSSSDALNVNSFCKKIKSTNGYSINKESFSPDVYDDSDIEILESTPEPVKKKDVTLLKINSTDSPELIPATPQCLSSNSLILNSKFNSFIKADLKPKKLLGNTFKSNKNVAKLASKLSLKRAAEAKTGISPVAKRGNESSDIKVPNSCKINLLSKINSPLPSDVSKSESEASFSILQPVLEFPKSLNERAIPVDVNKDRNLNGESICSRNFSSCNSVLNDDEDESDCNSILLNQNKLSCCISLSKPNLDHEVQPHEDKLIEYISLTNLNQDILKYNSIMHSNQIEFEERNSILETYEKVPNKDSFKEEEKDSVIENCLSQNMQTCKSIKSSEANAAASPLQADYMLPTVLGGSIGTNVKESLETSFTSEDSLDKLLSDNFDKLSPFKNPKQKHDDVQERNSHVEKLLSEGLGSLSFASRGNYGRYVVASVERDIYKREALLHLKSLGNRTSKCCVLSGFWFETVVKEGDIVHVLFTEEVNDKFHISNDKGMLVVNPDFLISGTSVVSGVFCQRKSVLNERFKGYDGGNKIMILGSLVHQLFQEVVQRKLSDESEISHVIHNLLVHPQILKEFYGMCLTKEEIQEEMIKFIPLIKSWSDAYLDTGKHSERIYPKDNWIGEVTMVRDIEENIWSPRFGIKGKIDLTIETKVGSSKKVVPLELKTGKPSFSAEHKGQVTLYSMIMSDRRDDPNSGLLLYLRDGSMKEVPAGEKEKKGLIQLRNEIVKYLSEKPFGKEDSELSLPSLPPPLDSKRMCGRCEHLLTCTALQKISREVPLEHHAMKDLISMATGHLSENHLEYFRKWCLMLHLEIGATNNEASIRSLWCQDAAQRESSGKCLARMIVPNDVDDMGNGYFVHVFERHVVSGVPEELPQCFQVGESVVVSSDKEIALTIGVVYDVEKYSVTIVLDKNLKLLSNNNKMIFYIDRCEYQNNMRLFFTNISELLRNTERHKRLRELIIDREPPQFNKGLDKSLLSQIKSILQDMNKEQQRAVLRSLLAKDYSILKGYPGTGKTSTIIGLVRLLNATGHSVLLTSYTHSAVDNILLKLKEYSDIKFLRLGKTSRIHKDILKYSDTILSKNMKTLSEIENFYNNSNIVATTCLGMSHVLFRRKSFDFCIMDEASQVLEAAALGPLFFCSRFILVGDSLQLPPVIKSQSAKNLGMMKSLFERLDNEIATVCLSLQYRMNEPIMNVANHLIYEGQLKCGTEELRTTTLNIKEECITPDIPSWLCKLVSTELKNSFFLVDTLNEAPEERDCSGQIINPLEAKVIFLLLNMFIKIGVPHGDVGVITPYRAQVRYLQEKMLPRLDAGGVVEVNTVDQYQGRDKSVILYSCVRSGLRLEDVKKGEILNDIRRLNVAVTRAKAKLIVLGNLATLHFYQPFEKLMRNVEKHQVYKLQDDVDGFSWSRVKNAVNL